MPPRASPSPDRAQATWRSLVRHQLGAFVATLVDFSTMIGLVELAGVPATAAAAIGASVGAATNFSLGRAWIFQRHRGTVAGQGVRYALVSAAGAGLNAAGEYLLHDRARLQYLVARMVVAVGVSLMWNFPMQRGFVFREGQLA